MPKVKGMTVEFKFSVLGLANVTMICIVASRPTSKRSVYYYYYKRLYFEDYVLWSLGDYVN